MIRVDDFAMRWVRLPLARVATFLDHLRRPVTATDRKAGVYPYYGANGQQGTIDDYIFDEPLVLLAEDGGNFDDPARTISYKVSGKTWVNNHAHVLRANPDLVSTDYLNRVLSYYDVRPFISGTTRAKLTKGDARKIPIPLPTPNEQRRIVELLEQADGLRRQRTEADALADRILPALFHKMFGDPATNPKGWPRKKLGDLLERIDSGWSPVCENRQARPDEWGVLKLGAVTTNHYLENENKALPAALDTQPELEVQAGDLLFTRKNTRELVGACAYVERTRPRLMLSDLVFRLRLKASAEVHPLYLWALLTYPSKRPSIQLLAGGSAGSMPNISKGRLETLEIEKPPYGLQTDFANALARFDSARKKAEMARGNIENLFSVLLHRAFTGELTAKWREAHLKELLVEMEHQARLLHCGKTETN